MTDVVAALIWDNDKFLACQRPANKSRALLWEFVGGKVESGESLQDALIRECREELNILVVPQNIFMTVIHEYPDITVRLILFNAYIGQGEPQKLEHNDIRWITPDQIDTLQFCPADRDILEVLKKLNNSRQALLYAYRDEQYKKFVGKLMPTVEINKIIGVRIPQLRKMKLSIEELGSLPHSFHEENLLHALAINRMADIKQCIEALDSFLPFVNNWSVCDTLNPPCFQNQSNEILEAVDNWLTSNHPYTVRFAILVLMKFYLKQNFSKYHLERISRLRFDHYYVKMMVAWYFATALSIHFEIVIPYLRNHKLDQWTHNKAIQKGIESFRLSKAQKEIIKGLKY